MLWNDLYLPKVPKGECGFYDMYSYTKTIFPEDMAAGVQYCPSRPFLGAESVI